MLILGIDTATPWGTVALSEDGKLIFEFALRTGKGSGEYLLALLQQVLPKTGRKLADLDLIAVGTGPGSYTGIRIGLAAVAGLAEGLRVPVYGVNTLRTIAENVRYGGGTPYMVAVALDARRAEAYTALYRIDRDRRQEIIAPQTLPVAEFAEWLREYQQVILCGDGGKNYRPVFAALSQLQLAPEDWDYPRAYLTTEIARRNYGTDSQKTSGLNVAPDYLRKVEAELRLEEKLRDGQNRANVCGRPGESN